MSEYGITILGTAGDSTVMGKQLRASGGFIIRTPENQLLIDPGPGSLVQQAKHDFHPRETTAIVLSHQHVNHAGDAAAVISAMTHNGMDKRGVLITNKDENLMVPQAQMSWVEKFFALEPEGKIGVNDVEIKAVSAKHYDTNAQGYLFYTPGYVVGYTGDTSYSDEFAKQFKDANILIVNCKYPDETSSGDHLNSENIISFLKHVKPQLVVLTHFGTKMISVDPLSQARKIQRESKVQVIAGKDGLHVAPANYNAEQKQKKISRY